MNQPVMFSHEFMRVLVITNNHIKEAVLRVGDMSVTDYCILQKLLMLDRVMELMEFRDFLHLKANTISTAVSRLERRGCVSKEQNERDSRKCRIEITEYGKDLSRKMSQAIRDSLRVRFWKTFDDERVNWGMIVDSKAFYLHSGDVERASMADEEDGDFVSPSWIMALKYISLLWTSALASETGLSLNEFRVLQLIAVDQMPYCSLDITRKLEIESSVVSRIIRSLRLAGFVEMTRSEDDKRSYVSTVTRDGEEVYRAGRCVLERVTEEYYATITPDERKRLSSWHKAMFEHCEPKS